MSTVGISLKVSERGSGGVDRLLAITDAGSRTEVIRRALAVYEHAVNRARSPVLDTLPEEPEETTAAHLPPLLLEI